MCIDSGLKVQIEWMIGIKKQTQIPQIVLKFTGWN